MLFKNLIKVPGKSFESLTKSDIADMIDAYLSDGNECFYASALPEFMIIPNKVEWIESVRLKILNIDEARRLYDNLDGISTVAGREDLKKIIIELR